MFSRLLLINTLSSLNFYVSIPLMPITRDNWEYFFQGAFAEYHVCSLFYFYGYEAQKISPDIGIDWMVTNVARARFNNENPLNVEVQVKSALFDQTGAFVKMHADEIDFLCEGEHRYCVFVLLSNLSGSDDPGSYERGDDPDASMAVERDIMRNWEGRASLEGRALRRKGSLSIYDFSEADVTIFWLHSSQMKRLRDNGLLEEANDGWRGLQIKAEEHRFSVAGMTLIPELYDLTYIVRPCKAGSRIRQGHMSMLDY
ncbi:hypothetical protein [Dechloromonas denitrificans]|uniref:hypothetical protein n=1 Tax=Dechloromonas denitrificans TaxID=281362 RepID=UPI001CFA7C06|nr:hypothetical protein [Dechloromonas denitrificans]UCV07028.1 hypothetical protein KI615_16715 [Dechloromonas denitrificans]